MTPNSRSDVPTEQKRAQEIPVGAEVHQMALIKVIPSVGAKQDAPIRRDGRRGRLIIEHPSGRRLVDGWIDTRVGAYAAATGRAVERYQRRAGISPIIAAIVETAAKRSRPPSGQV